jgi:hypothetical protein
MRRLWQEKGKLDGAVAIGLREMDARCVDAGLNKG